MFTQLHPAVPKRQAASLSVSLAVHLLFLGWLLHSPAPIFVAPSSVAKGESGGSLTRIYFGGDSGVTQEQPKPRLTLQRPPKTASPHRLEPPAAKREVGNEIASIRPERPGSRLSLRIALVRDVHRPRNSTSPADRFSRSGIWIRRGRHRQATSSSKSPSTSGHYCAKDRASKPRSCCRPEGARGAGELALHSGIQERRAHSFQAGRLLPFPALTKWTIAVDGPEFRYEWF